MNRIILTLCLCFIGLVINAQSGSLQGRILDENKLGMPGANIYIASIDKGTISDVDGTFILFNIPAGTHEITISYIGYRDTTISIDIKENETAQITLSLQPGVDLLEGGVLVLGDRLKGQAKALNQQKTNMNITNIVAADQIGRFPDANIGDAMKRIPGITMQGDQGEARDIIVRGLAPQLNSVTINGDRIPSAEADNRNIQMDLIPADMIQTIEVNKAVTPDMDADAIGGSVNLVTRPAPEDLRVSATAASGLNLLSQQPIWTGGLIIGDRFANNKIGVMLVGSYNDHTFGSDNVEAEWEQEVESPLTGEDINIDPYLTDHEIRQYEVRRVRRSVSGQLDFRLAPKHTIYVRGLYNWRDDWENRYVNTFTDIEPVFQEGTENVVGFEGVNNMETKAGLDNSRIRNARLEDQRIQNYSVQGEHVFGNLEVDWMASYSKASEERLNERYIAFETSDAFAINHNVSNPSFPEVTAQNPDDVAFSNLELDEITDETQYTEEEDMNARLDLAYNFNAFGESGVVKFGGRMRSKNKFRDNIFSEFSPLSGIETLADVELVTITKDNFLAGDQYNAGTFASPAFLGGLDLYNASLFEEKDKPDEYLPENYSADELVTAGYVMWDQKFNDQWAAIIGARIENTDINYIANVVADSEELIEERSGSDNYTNFLPGIHLRYTPQNNTVLRLAWTNTLARPNYFDLAPYRDVIAEDEEVFEGNINLEPTTSMNFDLMAEHYFKSVGLISGGVFYKNIDGFIYIQEGEDPTTGFDLFQPRNGGTADLYGFELTFQRQLDFLPGFLKGIGVYLNYTYITSEASGIRNEDGDLRENVTLPGAAPQMFNASLSYEDKRFIIRASVNYADAYIDELGDDAFYDRYYDQQLFLDVNASYAVTPSFRVFAEANNLTNQPLRYYQGLEERTMQMEYYNARFNLGVKYDLFQ